MNNFQKIKLLLLILLLFAGGYLIRKHFFNSWSLPSENKTPEAQLVFPDSTENLEIECFSLYYPITNIKKISLSKTKILTLSNGQDKVIICDVISDNVRYPLFWQHPIKNLELNELETRSIFLGKQKTLVEKLHFNNEKQLFIASTGNQSTANKIFNYEGVWKFNLLPPTVPAESEICFDCDSLIQSSKFYLNSFNLPVDKGYATQILNLWHKKDDFLNCDQVTGMSTQELSKVLKDTPISNSQKFKNYPWDIPDGWRDPSAQALHPVMDCYFNEAIENWQCSKNTKNESIIIAPKGSLCKDLPKNFQDQCFLDYFTEIIYPQNHRCVNRVFANFGHQPSILPFTHPTAKGLTLSQRGLILNEQSISLRFEQLIVKPVSQSTGMPIPCLTLIESSGTFSKMGEDLLFFMQNRYVNLDHKQICIQEKRTYKDIKTIFRATRDE